MSRLALDILDEMISEAATQANRVSLAEPSAERTGGLLGYGVRISVLQDARSRVLRAYCQELEAKNAPQN